jgi:hypothetical protein
VHAVKLVARIRACELSPLEEIEAASTALASSGVRPYIGVFKSLWARVRPTDGRQFARFWEAQGGASPLGRHDARVVLGGGVSLSESGESGAPFDGWCYYRATLQG